MFHDNRRLPFPVLHAAFRLPAFAVTVGLLLLASRPAFGEIAYVWANNPTAASYTPSPNYAYNPAGAIEIQRSATGTYKVRFVGMSFGNGDVQVTAYGSDNRSCKVVSWGGDTINVRCFDSAGNAADAMFTALFSRVAGGLPAYVWANDPTSASYTPNPTYAHNPSGAIQIQRSGTGTYRVRLVGMSLSDGDVQVTAYGSDNRSCKVVSWGGDTINVRCFQPNGALADARYTVLFNRRP